jgi:hypothetical protein
MCLLEFFINPVAPGEYNPHEMVQIGNTYQGNKLPGINMTEGPLRIPSRRCWIKYSGCPNPYKSSINRL